MAVNVLVVANCAMNNMNGICVKTNVDAVVKLKLDNMIGTDVDVKFVEKQEMKVININLLLLVFEILIVEKNAKSVVK